MKCKNLCVMYWIYVKNSLKHTIKHSFLWCAFFIFTISPLQAEISGKEKTDASQESSSLLQYWDNLQDEWEPIGDQINREFEQVEAVILSETSATQSMIKSLSNQTEEALISLWELDEATLRSYWSRMQPLGRQIGESLTAFPSSVSNMTTSMPQILTNDAVEQLYYQAQLAYHHLACTSQSYRDQIKAAHPSAYHRVLKTFTPFYHHLVLDPKADSAEHLSEKTWESDCPASLISDTSETTSP